MGVMYDFSGGLGMDVCVVGLFSVTGAVGFMLYILFAFCMAFFFTDCYETFGFGI